MKPVVLRNVALGDRHEAGEPRFRRQEVVKRGVESSRALGVRQAIPDRENASPSVVQKIESHAIGDSRHPLGQRAQCL